MQCGYNDDDGDDDDDDNRQSTIDRWWSKQWSCHQFLQKGLPITLLFPQPPLHSSSSSLRSRASVPGFLGPLFTLLCLLPLCDTLSPLLLL